MKARIVSAVAVLALAATTLTACRSNVGTAATVAGHRISENTVSDYVDQNVTPKTDASGQTPAVKPSIVQILVLEQVFRATLVRNGGVPSAGALASSHDEAISVLTNGQVDPKSYESQLRTNLPTSGIRASLVPNIVRVQELEYALIRRLGLRTQAEVATVVRKAGVTVRVNPRYGSWNPAQAEFVTTGPTPSFLHLQDAQTGTQNLPGA